MHNLHSANLNRHRTKTGVGHCFRCEGKQIHTSWASKTYLALSQCLTPSLARLVRSEVRLVICQDTAASLAYLDAVWSTSPCTMRNAHPWMLVSMFLLAWQCDATDGQRMPALVIPTPEVMKPDGDPGTNTWPMLLYLASLVLSYPII